MNASADVFRAWGNVSTREGDYVVNESAGQHNLRGLQAWNDTNMLPRTIRTIRASRLFRKGIGFQ